MNMKKRIAIVVLAAMLLSLPGCAQRGQEVPEASSMQEVSLTNDPAALYTGVETDKKVISLVFEGFSQLESMEKIVELMDERNVRCVFFLSGVTVSEQPELVRKIHDAGLTLGNYGMTGEKNMGNNSVENNLRQFTRAQELFREICGSAPTLFRCNGTEYTQQMLQAGAAAGLSGAVQPTCYLNHRSFTGEADAKAYVQRLVRGSILSVKLGQELDAAEYGQVVDIQEMRPAIDPEPGISDVDDDIPRSIYETLEAGVAWLLDTLEYEGYTIVPPEQLPEYAVDLFEERELGNAEELDASQYVLPLTREPLTSVETRAGTQEDLSGAVFVGDSVMEGLEGYVNWRRANDGKKTQPYLDGVRFLTDARLTVEADLMQLNDSSSHPVYDQTRMTIEDALHTMGAERIYLMLQCADPLVYSGSRPLDNVRLLLYLIQKESPDAQICVVSYPPNRSTQSGVRTNSQIFRYNLELCRLCRQLDIPFLDAASVLRDGTGMLAREYCMDESTYGIHLSDAGCQTFLDFILGHIPIL